MTFPTFAFRSAAFLRELELLLAAGTSGRRVTGPSGLSYPVERASR